MSKGCYAEEDPLERLLVHQIAHNKSINEILDELTKLCKETAITSSRLRDACYSLLRATSALKIAFVEYEELEKDDPEDA